MNEKIKDIYLTNAYAKKQWQTFLKKRGIDNFSEEEIKAIKETIGIFNDDNELVATGSITDNIIKYVAVCDIGVQKGSRFNKIISELEDRLMQQNKFHYFVFTKPEYQISFEHVGFEVLAQTDMGVILEKGVPNINDYLQSIPKFENSHKIASIVMNANPFTKGHRYLVEKASQENEHVYVFVVNQDASLFTTNERLELVKKGTADLDNVVVVSGGDYMVSFVSFPSYFIKNTDEIINYQTLLDARIFKEQIISPLKITSRYLGEEPLSHTTNLYNQTLKRELSDKIEVKIIKRLAIDNTVVSATKIRQAIAQNNVRDYEDYLPDTTMDFIMNNLDILQSRIKKGQKIDGN